MFQLFMDKQFLPVIITVAVVLFIMLVRPSFLIRSSKDKNCPYCLNPWLVSIAALIAGGITYAVVNQEMSIPKLSMYGQ